MYKIGAYGLPLPKGLELLNIIEQNLCKSAFQLFLSTKFNANILNSYAHGRLSKNIFNFVTFKKSKMTSPFDWNEAGRLTNLTKVWQD